MAISDEEKVDLLWKKFIYGVSKTEVPGNKSPSNETRPSPIVALGNQIWINAKDIPGTPPAATTDAVKVSTVLGDGAIQLTMIQDSSDAKAWRAFEADGVTPIENWIPFSLGPAYALKLWVGDPSVVNPAPTMLFLDGSGNNDEYFFDYKAGILYFIGSNLPVSSTSPLYIEGYRYVGPLDISVFDSGGGGGCGNEIKLCAPTDGDLTDPAITGTSLGVTFNKGVAVPLTVDDNVTDAIDGLNEIVGLLLPDPPPGFPNSQQLTFSSTGNNPKLCAGVSNYAKAANTLNAGDSVTRIPMNVTRTGLPGNYIYNPASLPFSSNVITQSGSGNSGTLYARRNEANTNPPADLPIAIGTIMLDNSDNVGSNSSLEITGNSWFPSETPGFWQAFDCKINLDAIEFFEYPGVHDIRVDHTQHGGTNSLIVIDDLVALPNLDITTAEITDVGAVIVMSSGVQHYGQGSTLIFEDLGFSDIAGTTYYGGDFFSAFIDPGYASGSNKNPFDSFSKDYSDFALTVPLSEWINLQYMNDVYIALNNTHSAKKFQVKIELTNVNGSLGTIYPRGILYLNGQPVDAIVEDYIPVLGIPGASGNGERVKMASSLPQPDKYSQPTPWDNTAQCTNHEATIVGGKLSHDHTDYRGYLPSNPGVSASLSPNYDIAARQNNQQFVTFKFSATGVSNFDIDVQGTYSGCYVRLEGITDGFDLGNANDAYSTTSWWDMFQAAEAFGIPGDNTASYPATANGSNGCANSETVMDGNSGRFNCTFGNANSSDAQATGDILVRFILDPDQEITFLRFLDPTY